MSTDHRVSVLADALKVAATNTRVEVEEREAAAVRDGGDSIEELEHTENLRGYIEGLDHALSIIEELWS